MKKKLTVGVLSVLALLIFTGCTNGNEKEKNSEASNRSMESKKSSTKSKVSQISKSTISKLQASAESSKKVTSTVVNKPSQVSSSQVVESTTNQEVVSPPSESISSSVLSSEPAQSSSQVIQSTTTTISSEPINQAQNQDYYTEIKKVWQHELNYINSITDPHLKQAVQTPEAAATSEATFLLGTHPEDSTIINESLKKVLSGE